MSESPVQWDAEGVRALREQLGLTQQQLADELGVRQQTVSEWETGIYQPRGASARMLRAVAERASAVYDTGSGQSAIGNGGGADETGSPQG
ncbi:MAG: helix-turn-helix domain-containing protein [Dehalococcoidia bacterium]